MNEGKRAADRPQINRAVSLSHIADLVLTHVSEGPIDFQRPEFDPPLSRWKWPNGLVFKRREGRCDEFDCFSVRTVGARFSITFPKRIAQEVCK